MSTIQDINAFLASQLQGITGAPAPALHASLPVQTQEQLLVQLQYMLDRSRQQEQLQKIIHLLQKRIGLLQQERLQLQQLRPERCVASQDAHAPPLEGFSTMVNHPQAPVLYMYRPSQVSCESFFPLKSPRIRQYTDFL
jgi:hypothetical protein